MPTRYIRKYNSYLSIVNEPYVINKSWRQNTFLGFKVVHIEGKIFLAHESGRAGRSWRKQQLFYRIIIKTDNNMSWFYFNSRCEGCCNLYCYNSRGDWKLILNIPMLLACPFWKPLGRVKFFSWLYTYLIKTVKIEV